MPINESSSLKVLQLPELYPPGWGGGAAVYAQEVCRLLAERGHDIRVLCTEITDDAPYSIRTTYDGPVRVDRLNAPFRRIDPGTWHMSLREWREHKERVRSIAEDIFREWVPDIVQFHTPYPLLEEILPSLLERNIPVVGMLHDSWTICPRLNLFKSPDKAACSGPTPTGCLECLYSHFDGSRTKALMKLPWRTIKFGVYPAYRLRERTFTRHAIDGVFGYSKFISDYHRGFVNRVEFIPLGVDLTGLPAERPIRPRNPIRFIFNAGFQEHKGIWDVLDAAQTLNNKGYEFELHIWGPNQDMAEITKRGLENRVLLRGMFDSKDRWRIYAEADVLLMATRTFETAPRVLQEAAAMGVPSIAPDQGGISEVIRDGIDGLLFTVRDRSHLERQMIKVLERPELVKEFASNLWRVVDIREAVGRIADFYRTVLRERNLQAENRDSGISK